MPLLDTLNPSPLEGHVHIVALTPDLRRVSFYSVTDFLHHGSTTELILSLILKRGAYRGLGNATRVLWASDQGSKHQHINN